MTPLFELLTKLAEHRFRGLTARDHVVTFVRIKYQVVQALGLSWPIPPAVIEEKSLADAIVTVWHCPAFGLVVATDILPSLGTDGPLRFIATVIVDLREDRRSNGIGFTPDQGKYRYAL